MYKEKRETGENISILSFLKTLPEDFNVNPEEEVENYRKSFKAFDTLFTTEENCRTFAKFSITKLRLISLIKPERLEDLFTAMTKGEITPDTTTAKIREIINRINKGAVVDDIAIAEDKPKTSPKKTEDKPEEETGDKPEETGDKPEETGDKPEETGDKPEEVTGNTITKFITWAEIISSTGRDVTIKYDETFTIEELEELEKCLKGYIKRLKNEKK